MKIMFGCTSMVDQHWLQFGATLLHIIAGARCQGGPFVSHGSVELVDTYLTRFNPRVGYRCLSKPTLMQGRPAMLSRQVTQTC